MLKSSTFFCSFLNFLRRTKMFYIFLKSAQQNGLISNFESELRSEALCRLIKGDWHF